MAFLMKYEINNTGLIGEYWRIIDFKVDVNIGVIYVTSACYKDKESRDSGKHAICTFVDTIVLTDILYQELSTPALNMLDIYDNLRSVFYKQLKLNRFLEAQDI